MLPIRPAMGAPVHSFISAPRGAAVQFGGSEDSRRSRFVSVDSISGERLSLSQVVNVNEYSQVRALPQGQLELEYDKPYVIGRAEGFHVPYLAPNLQVTRQVPGSTRSVPIDGMISRAHFQMIARKDGIELVNGVPMPGGALRAPTNGTWLLAPEDRPLKPGEVYKIEPGKQAKIKIGVNTVLLLTASEDPI